MSALTRKTYQQTLARLRLVVVLIGLVTLVGTIGYWIMGMVNHEHWSFFDCLYMTIITITTVGYGEVLDLSHTPGARVYTMILLLVGCGMVLSCFSMLTAFIVEGSLGAIFWRKRMQRSINELTRHIIVCGAGETGAPVVLELTRTQNPVVVIDRDDKRLADLAERADFLSVHGDAEDEEVLIEAGIERAAGLVSCLPEDKDNVFVVITARALNPMLRIVAKGILQSSSEKLQRAGASAVVSPNSIGGLRMASEIIRPRVVGFLDEMLRDHRRVIRVESVVLPDDSPLNGVKLKDSRIFEQTGLLVVAARLPAAGAYSYNPGGELELGAGAELVVIGEVSQINELRKLAGAS